MRSLWVVDAVKKVERLFRPHGRDGQRRLRWEGDIWEMKTVLRQGPEEENYGKTSVKELFRAGVQTSAVHSKDAKQTAGN